MIDPARLICYCNDKTVADIVNFIKNNNIERVEDLIDQEEMPLGNKCESCIEEGYENDGYSLNMVLSLVKEGRL